MLRTWGETELADHFNKVGRKLLDPTYDPRKDRRSESAGGGSGPAEETFETMSYLDVTVDDVDCNVEPVANAVQTTNSELNALELNIQKLTKQSLYNSLSY